MSAEFSVQVDLKDGEVTSIVDGQMNCFEAEAVESKLLVIAFAIRKTYESALNHG